MAHGLEALSETWMLMEFCDRCVAAGFGNRHASCNCKICIATGLSNRHSSSDCRMCSTLAVDGPEHAAQQLSSMH